MPSSMSESSRALDSGARRALSALSSTSLTAAERWTELHYMTIGLRATN